MLDGLVAWCEELVMWSGTPGLHFWNRFVQTATYRGVAPTFGRARGGGTGKDLVGGEDPHRRRPYRWVRGAAGEVGSSWVNLKVNLVNLVNLKKGGMVNLTD